MEFVRKIPVCLIAVAILISTSASKAADAASELVKKADSHRGLQGSFSVDVKTIFKDKTETSEQGYRVDIRDSETSLVKQTLPVRAAGRKLLMKGLDMWLFTPQVKKPVRISLQQRLTGDIANGDISRTDFAHDYNATTVGKDAAMGATILELRAKDKRVTYSRIKYWIEDSSGKPLRADFFALNGKLMKTATFSDFKKIQGLDRMTKVTIKDAMVSSRESVILYSNHKPQTFSDGEFNKEQMDR